VRPVHLALPTLLAALFALPAGTAAAAPVLVYDSGGHGTRVNDPFLPADRLPPPPGTAARPPAPPTARASVATVRGVLGTYLSNGQLTRATHDRYIGIWNDALVTRNQLTGVRRYELTAAINSLGGITIRGLLTRSRLEALFLQLARNTAVWGRYENLPTIGERVRFPGSRLLFQYYRGQGLQFHPLANWGRVQGLLNGGYVANGVAMIDELLRLGSYRGTALTWEYYFYFGGGRPPWTSGLSQGTALVALSTATRKTGDPRFVNVARQGLRLYELSAPLGVRVRTRYGNHYAEYSFAPRLRIINGFIQALNGIHDVYTVSRDPRALALFRSGHEDARHALPYYDTGRWSRYDNTRGSLSSVGYHILLRDFVRGLCTRTRFYAYCSKATRFTYYLRLGYPSR